MAATYGGVQQRPIRAINSDMDLLSTPTAHTRRLQVTKAKYLLGKLAAQSCWIWVSVDLPD
jgi:hypothetical protein